MIAAGGRVVSKRLSSARWRLNLDVRHAEWANLALSVHVIISTRFRVAFRLNKFPNRMH